MSPFEIRLELLKMAQGMLTDDYFNRKTQIETQWNMECETARIKGTEPPKFPEIPPFPTEQEIITKATALNAFVSSIPPENVGKNKKQI